MVILRDLVQAVLRLWLAAVSFSSAHLTRYHNSNEFQICTKPTRVVWCFPFHLFFYFALFLSLCLLLNNKKKTHTHTLRKWNVNLLQRWNQSHSRKMFKRLVFITNEYKIVRGMISYAVLWPLGSLIEQTLVEDRNFRTYDWMKCLRYV